MPSHTPDPGWFWCTTCHQTKEIQTTGGTGYANGPNDERICYACVADIDRAAMVATGKASLYWTHDDTGNRITNWPGTLAFPVKRQTQARHNSAGVVTFLYFDGPDGHEWSARVVGRNTQIAHCRRLKGRAS